MSQRRSMLNTGGPTRPPFLVGVAMATLMVLGACSGGSGASTTTEVPPPSTTSSSPNSSTSTVTSTVSNPTTTTVPDEGVAAAWSSYWQAWAEVRASDDLDPGPLEAVASADVVEGAIALFDRQRSSDQGPVETDFELHPSIEATEADKATLEDCVLLAPSFTDAVGVWHEADLVRTEGGWIVDAVRIRSAGGCVPDEMAEAAIDGYEAYYAARAVFWDPPDPGHPLVDEVLADPQKRFIVGLLEEHEADGVALRGRPATHPEVIEVRNLRELVILSCLEPAPDYGLYDLETGERLPNEPPVKEGQTDLESAVMIFEDGAWKVADLQGQVDFECEFAPTERGLPSV